MKLSSEKAFERLCAAMEEALGEKAASQVGREAIGASGGTLPEIAQFWSFVNGPLKDVLHQRCGAVMAQALLARLHPVVRDFAGEPPQDRLTPPLTVATDSTLEVQGGSSVLVVAASQILEVRVQLAMPKLKVFTVSAEVDLFAGSLALAPSLLVVDATDPAAIAGQRVVELIAGDRMNVMTVLWGKNTTAGKNIATLLQQSDAPVTLLDETESIEPILDLIRVYALATPRTERVTPEIVSRQAPVKPPVWPASAPTPFPADEVTVPRTRIAAAPRHATQNDSERAEDTFVGHRSSTPPPMPVTAPARPVRPRPSEAAVTAPARPVRSSGASTVPPPLRPPAVTAPARPVRPPGAGTVPPPVPPPSITKPARPVRPPGSTSSPVPPPAVTAPARPVRAPGAGTVPPPVPPPSITKPARPVRPPGVGASPIPVPSPPAVPPPFPTGHSVPRPPERPLPVTAPAKPVRPQPQAPVPLPPSLQEERDDATLPNFEVPEELLNQSRKSRP